MSNADGDSIVEQAQQKAGEVAGQVQEKAGAVVDQVKQQATSRIDQQKDMAAGNLWSVANAIRDTGQSLRDKDQGAIAQVVDRGAEQVERLSSYLAHRDVNQILTEAQHFARRQPALFVGGAFALGMLGARFLKSTGQPPKATQSEDYSGQAYKLSADGVDNYRDASLKVADTTDEMGGWSGDFDSGASTAGSLEMSRADNGAGGYSSPDSGYTGYTTAPPLRGTDPRISGGYSLQGSDVAGGGTTESYGSNYGQGYDQGYAQGSNGSIGQGPDTGSGDNGTTPYRQDSEA